MKLLSRISRVFAGLGKKWFVLPMVLALLSGFSLAGVVPVQVSPVYAAGTLTVEIIAAPNLVVDSNALATSTYAPQVATVIGRFCNTGSDPVGGVVAHIGDYAAGTPGVYPPKTDVTIGGQLYSGTYRFTHLGGVADATRFLGTLAPGECRYQYWSFEYPHLANGGTIPTWGGSVKPDDDLSLNFDVWVTGDGDLSANATHTATMRNEISAMANKIKPNGSPAGRWFNTTASTVNPGETITTNGILYRLGNVNQGFDNDGDGVPDYNAWLQPFGDPAYDPSCFRLIRTSGVLTVTRSAGNPDLIIPFEDNLYFTDLPPDNTDVRGKVYYQFLALGGVCTIPISPYQEVASGADNEKFNGDYGTGVPALLSSDPEVVISKNAPGTQAENTTFTYSIPFQNNSTTARAGVTLSLSSGTVNAGLMISDTVPAGLTYVGGSAAANNTVPAGNSFSIRYSTDGGATWTATDPGDTPSTAGSRVVIQWWLDEPLDVSGSAANSGVVTYQATIPSGYLAGGGDPLIENCTEAGFGDGAPFAEACATTLVPGTASIGDRVWQDENGDGAQAGESSIADVTVWLYWDRNGDARLDAGDVLVGTRSTTAANPNYDFTQLPAGKYLVKVDATDAQLPAGYSLTTAGTYAVALTAGQNYDDADFGFGPTLRLTKRLDSLDPAVVSGTVAFKIDLVNTRPGDGTANGYCLYDVWSSATETDGTANKQFADIANAVGAPNSTYASASYSTGGNQWLAGAAYSSGGRSSGITSVQAVMDLYQAARLLDDGLIVSLAGGATSWDHTFSATDLNAYGPGEGKKGQLTVTIPGTAAPGGSWDWSDFDDAALKLRLDMDKTGSPESTAAVLLVDALGFVVTTDDTSCATGDSTIDPLPMTDTYDPGYLQFLYADPPASSHTAGTITWDNLGPLYAGGTRTVMVYYEALSAVVSTTNTASVTTARFSSGRDVNSVTDHDTVGIAGAFSLSGKTWIDSSAVGWTGSTGYDTPFPGSDNPLPNVEMDLYVCTGAAGLPIALDTNRNNACGAEPGESWDLVATTYSDYNGDYAFVGLRPGYYNVQANDKNLPAGMAQRTGEASGAAGGAGIGGNPCATCDGAWNEQATVVKNLAYLSADTTQVNFGYNNPSFGTVTGYVWHDRDQGGYDDWDTGEPPIPGAMVTLYCSGAGCAQPVYTTTADQNGYYQFSGLNPGDTATYQVVVTPPGGTGQSADPNYTTGSCYGDAGNCDNQTDTFTLAAGGAHGADRFGYYGGLRVGDTVYVDWNGDGSQDATTEEGIAGVQVRLYLDANLDGVLDGGDPLLGTADTDAQGRYEFSGVPGNSRYVVKVNAATLPAGYTQTADPDVSPPACGGAACDALDPLALGSTDYLEADFGYQPRGFGAIGDTVWADADADGVLDATESGISGVTVKLYQDQDGDGSIDTKDALMDTRITLGYAVLDGYVDVSGDGSIGIDDDHASLHGVAGVDGGLDVNGNGSLDAGDDGTFVGYTVVDGRLDLDGSGSVTAADDGDLLGRYQFTALAAGAYIVEIPAGNFGSGQPLYSLTQTYDPDSATLRDNQDQVTLGSAEIYTSADFGYTSSAIGDLVWQDNDGDGIRDAGEPGIDGVVVELYLDANNDGVTDGAAVATTTTAPNSQGEPGYYLFGGLAANNYIVKVADSNFATGVLQNYVLTGDPDSYRTDDPTNLSCQPPDGAQGCDSINCLKGITAPDLTFFPGLQLGQNDLGSDFGYRPDAAVGDTLWIDSDADGVRDPGEPGISLITVRLCGDATCSGGALQATETDENGTYSFGGGMSDEADYYVVVDTGDVDWPAGLTQTYDPVTGNGCNGGTCTTSPGFHVDLDRTDGSVAAIGGNACAAGTNCDMNVDFGYRFHGTNTLQGTIWWDGDAENKQIDPAETVRYGNVPVYLWHCGADALCGNGDDVLAGQTTSDANGEYSFAGLADGTYRVIANADAYSLRGTSTTTPVSVDENGTDSPTASFSGGGGTAIRNFGYKSAMDMGDLPAAYHNTTLADNGARHVVPGTGAVYLGSSVDLDADGQYTAAADGDDNDGNDDDDGVVRAGSTWTAGPDGGAVEVTVGGCAGTCYLSAWADWNQDGALAGGGERILLDRAVADGAQTVSFDIPAGTDLDGSFFFRFRLYESSSHGLAQPTGLASNGEVEDYLFTPLGPTAVLLAGFGARADGSTVVLAWETVSEMDLLGLNLYRAGSLDGQQTRLNGDLIAGQAPGCPVGAAYTFVDALVQPGGTYYYWLQMLDVQGDTDLYGPVSVEMPAGAPARYRYFLPAIYK
jgi:protocatechuate 3,4-dioxygenase beta subunit